MAIVILFLAVSVVFLVADAIMLSLVIQPVFQRHIGESLLGGFRLLPAFLFYLTYVGGILWFAAIPAWRDGEPMAALVNGAVLGFVAYGTYELTSWAVMKEWHPAMVAVDMAWGTVVTALAAVGGVAITRALGYAA